jgi:sporulation protein YpjB
MKMKGTSIIIVLLLIFFCLPVYTFAQESPLSRLDSIADEALQMTKVGRFEEAKMLLEYFSEEFENVTVEEKMFSMDELRILTVAHDDALQSVTNTSITNEQRVNSVTTFRLVLDALSSQHQPLWTEMEDPIMSAFQQVKEAAHNKNSEAYHDTLNAFLNKYNIIQPSIKLDIPVEKVQQLDARITFIDRYRQDMMEGTEAMKELSQLETELEKLFDGVTEDEADPSLWWVIISTGSIIILTLSYVGWKKYRGEEENKTERLKD